MDGMETTMEIRKWENEEYKRKYGVDFPTEPPLLQEASRIPVIALTANAVATALYQSP